MPSRRVKGKIMIIAETMERRAREFVDRYTAVHQQIGRVIVGHDEIVHGVLTCLFVGGHCLLEGVPGLGKTLLVRTLARPSTSSSTASSSRPT